MPKNLLNPLKEASSHSARWEMIALIASIEMRWLYELVDEDNLDEFCRTQEQKAALKEFMKSFGDLKHLAAGIDGYIFKALKGKINQSNVRYWLMVSEYCKLRLLGHGEARAKKWVKSWNIRTDFKECNRVCERFLRDESLKKRVERLKKKHGECVENIEKLRQLMVF